MALRLERRGRRQRSARQAAARRVGRAAWSVRLSGRPHSEALSVRRDAAVAPLCFHRAEARLSAALSGPELWQVPAAASHQPAEAAVESSVRPAPSAQQPAAAEEARVVSAAEAQPREAAEAASDAEEAQPPEAAGVA